MTDVANLTLEQLKAFRSSFDDFREKVERFIDEQRAVNIHVGTLVREEMMTRAHLAELEKRIELLERRAEFPSDR